MINKLILAVLCCCSAFSIAGGCTPSITTASGFSAPQQICSGNLIFEENFDSLDKNKWKPQVSFWGGGVSVIFYLYKTFNLYIHFRWRLNSIRMVNFNGMWRMMKTALQKMVNFT